MDLIQRAKKVLSMNKVVRSMSGENKSTEVHWEFFNQVYDCLADIVNEELVWEKRYHRLLRWAEEANVACMDEELNAKLEILRREVEGGA